MATYGDNYPYGYSVYKDVPPSFLISYRYGDKATEGYGFSKNTGDYWPNPYDYVRPLTVRDSNGQRRLLLLSRDDAKIYWMDTHDGPPGTSMSKVWQDRCDTNGDNGADISPVVKFREDRGSREHYFIEHLKTYLALRPEDESDGYPSGLEVNLDIYKDGAPSTETAGADDITKDGEIVYDRRVIGHRIQTKVTFNRSKLELLGRFHDYVAKDEISAPSDHKPNETTYQASLAGAALWISRGSNLLFDRVGQSTLSGAGSATTGPDGKTNSALTISSTVSLANSAQASGMLLLWHKSGYTVTGVTLTEVSNNGTWYLSYASGSIPANLELGAGDVFDVRLFSSVLDSDTLTYAYNDVINNSGKATLPVW